MEEMLLFMEAVLLFMEAVLLFVYGGSAAGYGGSAALYRDSLSCQPSPHMPPNARMNSPSCSTTRIHQPSLHQSSDINPLTSNTHICAGSSAGSRRDLQATFPS
eukprot:3419395-Rhodomonas_salina.1